MDGHLPPPQLFPGAYGYAGAPYTPQGPQNVASVGSALPAQGNFSTNGQTLYSDASSQSQTLPQQPPQWQQARQYTDPTMYRPSPAPQVNHGWFQTAEPESIQGAPDYNQMSPDHAYIGQAQRGISMDSYQMSSATGYSSTAQNYGGYQPPPTDGGMCRHSFRYARI
ncbi:hypothetical protein MPH_12798 [Macrophomina phaseolina MS6]|uniref:Uncharacterized protein n=1 Tax=Macrophomina phaseolina (strain MS6) TaxID=1126212 RepID=K2R7D2_MACPH|nr:hypothetical protein MPH_12798 [Macrophomina phaseolina MS6]